MSVEDAKAKLDPGPGDPVSGYISAVDVQDSYDDLHSAWLTDIGVSSPGANTGIAYWDGFVWDDRPAVNAGERVTWSSVLDVDAPAPSGALIGDVWDRAPGAGV